MTEPQKNSISIDGGEVKDTDHKGTYKTLPDTDAEFRKSKSSLGKSKEKVSLDGAEEKLLQKEAEARIVTRVDMADAKYVVGDIKNGDAKIELDAKKGQFSGLTKEELLKYADDPCWVRVRWTLFALFWLAWLGMLVGAVVIIMRAPKCSPPPTRTWYEKGPLIDMVQETYSDVESKLPALQSAHIEGVFVSMCGDGQEHFSYEVLDDPNCIDQFKGLVTKAKEYGVRVMVELAANFVPITHSWFLESDNKTDGYDDYFIWANGKGFDDATGKPNLPNNWVSYDNKPAWSWSAARKQFYLRQVKDGYADLNLANPEVVRHFDTVLKLYRDAGASGIRLVYARELLVNRSLADETPAAGRAGGAGHTERAYWRHKQASDQPALADLLAHWSAVVGDVAEPHLFTVREEEGRAEMYLGGQNATALRPPSAAPVSLDAPPLEVAAAIARKLTRWPILKIWSERQPEAEVTAWALCPPAAPLVPSDLPLNGSELSRLAALRSQPSFVHGSHAIHAAPLRNSSGHVLVCMRWSPGHTGYVFVNNGGAAEARADLRGLPSLPPTLALYRAPPDANFTMNAGVPADDVPVPPLSTVILSYAPLAAAAQ